MSTAFYYSRLTGTGTPFSLVSASWTSRPPATLGASHYSAMMTNLATLSGEVQGDFAAANRDDESARKGIMVAQGPDYDVLWGNETGDGWTNVGGNITTSSTQMLPQNVSNMSWYPYAHRPWAYGKTGGTSGVMDAPQAHATPEGGNDANAIQFTEASYNAARTDVEEWIADITNFWTSLGAGNKFMSYATLESFDEGAGLWWVADPPWLGTYREPGTGFEDSDDLYCDYSGSTLYFYWTNCSNLNDTVAQTEFRIFLGYYTNAGGANVQSNATTRALTFTANTGNWNGTVSDVNTAYPCRAIIKFAVDGRLKQAVAARFYTGA